MIAHIILFRPRQDLPAEEWQAFSRALAAAWREIGSIRRFHIGRRIRLGRDYEQAMAEDYAYAAVIEFDDEPGLREYLDHPSHEDVGRRFGATSAAALAYDYEMLDPGRLERLFDAGAPALPPR